MPKFFNIIGKQKNAATGGVMFESLKRTAFPIANGQSFEDQPSEIARGAALLRALAAVDEREEIKGPDYLAEIFLAEDRKSSFKDPVIKEWLIKNYLPYGTYAYSIARTAYFDHVVEQALRDNVPQIVFLGAGYDSRPYRFRALINETRIFELDDCTTQQRKKELLQKANIPIPGQLIYVPVGDNKDTLKDLLVKAGFDNKKLSLFLCEGVTYYLPATEVDDILSFIKSDAPAGSTFCFDYKCLPPEKSGEGSSNELQEIMKPAGDAEAARFGIEEGQIGTFLGKMEFIVLENLTAEELERKYLTLRDGSSVGKVPARHCIVYASVL
jgi:methyltransferase (TIGR00027 family)